MSPESAFPVGASRLSPDLQEVSTAVELSAAILANPDLCASLSAIRRFGPFVHPNLSPTLEDFNLLGHLRSTLRIASSIVPIERVRGALNADGAQLVYIAAIVHDLGELAWSIRKEDINFALKKDEHDEIEREYFHRHLTAMLPTASHSALQLARRAFDEVALPQTSGHESSAAARVFDSIERAGYIDTAVIVFHTKPGEIDHEWLPLSVLYRQIARFEELVPQFPGLADFLSQRGSLLSAILDHFVGYPDRVASVREREAKAIRPLPEIEFSSFAGRWRRTLSLASGRYTE